jgi:hypothetical protein
MLDAIAEDCTTLLERALLNKTVFMFGEDGNGRHGRSEFPVYSEISEIRVFLSSDDDDNPSDVHGIVQLHLPDYDCTVHGHAITDQNLRISMNMLLQAACIDVDALTWADISQQGLHSVAFSIDVEKLLDWA